MTVSKRIITVAALIAVVSLAPGAAAPPTALAAGSRIVDNYYPSPTACKGAGYRTIQDAANNIALGQSGTITVCAGNYAENVTLTGRGKIKFVGQPGATLVAVDATSLISVSNTTQVTIQGFTLDGHGYAINSGLIDIQDTSAVITKNVFQNVPNGYGVYDVTFGGKHTLSVTNNQFMTVRSGIYAISPSGALSARVTGNFFTNGVYGMYIAAVPGGSTTATVTGNHLQGASGTGIHVVGVDKANVSGNTVQDFSFGIFMADSSHTTVSGNKVRGTDYGIELYASGADASSNKVQGNILEVIGNNFTGIYVFTAGARAADLNQITGNTITDPSGLSTGSTGINLNNAGASIDKTVIKGNKLINIDTVLDATGDSGTVISGNTCTPTVCVF